MGIETDNPKTILEKADALGNIISQIRLATLTGDKEHLEKSIQRAEDLSFELVQQIQEEL